eukprot:5264598-Pyramimonas_sp.AAC.1
MKQVYANDMIEAKRSGQSHTPVDTAAGPFGALGTPEMVPDPGQHVPLDPPGTQNPEEFPIFGVAHVHMYLVGQTLLFLGRLDLLDGARDLGGRPGPRLIF